MDGRSLFRRTSISRSMGTMSDRIAEIHPGERDGRRDDAPCLALSELIVPAFSQALTNLGGQLDRATEHAAGGGVPLSDLLHARLAPDMHPLGCQIAFASLQARECIARLQGAPLPATPEFGTPARARRALEDALAVLAECDRTTIDLAADRAVELRLPGSLRFVLHGREYVRDWAIPQFYFHLVTAYAILRREGVPLGKADFVPHMFRYLVSLPEEAENARAS